MQLTQIDIIKYKSIKQPVSIVLNSGRVVVLIGKNGSGKTNVLEAMRLALSKNRFLSHSKHECNIKYHFELTDDETAEYFSCVQAENKSKQIVVDSDSNFIQKLKDSAYRDCYYLDNEKSLLFYDRAASDYENRNVKQQYLNSYNPIMEAFDVFLHDSGVIGNDVSLAQHKGLTDSIIKKIVLILNTKFLPGIVAAFDSDEVVKFGVDYEDGNFELYVHEKSGDVVPFNQTSLGRRWYLTYQFVKTLLKPGDMLFIDEPAAFLHQQAQLEVRRELSELGRDGVYVFYSTHSPYMIPEDWGQVYNVTMTEHGTQAENFSSGDELCDTIRNELGATTTADILFNLSKTVMLVEGIADRACIEKFAELFGYDLSNYHIHVCDGDAILQVAYVCLKYNMKVKVVLDNDNKYKDDWYKHSYSMYDECIRAIVENKKNCVFVGNGEHGCLEDLFVEPKGSDLIHFSKKKGKAKVNIDAIRKLKSVKQISKQTRENFEQLFDRIGLPKSVKHK